MANYNSGHFYNSRINYNSATYFIVEVSDSGQGIDIVSILSTLSIAETGTGVDLIAAIAQYPASQYFVITSDGVLQPLDVTVLADSRYNISPSLKEFTEEVPGRHGEIYFGSKLGSKLIELHVASPDGMTPEQKEEFRAQCARYLNPCNGAKLLIYLDDEGKTYSVKYAGLIDPAQYADWLEFTIPFKAADPYRDSIAEKTLTGTGIITNAGNVEVSFKITIVGPITDPSVTIGIDIISYTGTINAGSTLIISTDSMTAELDGVDVLDDVAGDLSIQLQPGNISVTAENNCAISWTERWSG